MTINRCFLVILLLSVWMASAQIRVDPAVVNVNAQGASTVFLSYGFLRPDQFSVEALWCAGVVSAAPDIGVKCDPANTWGRLPLRNDLTRPSGRNGFTDIMTIPQNVIRRAYQKAARGSGSSFYYVRRFSSRTGAPDEYIAIVCQLSGRGSETTLALTDVRLRFSTEKNVLSTPVGQPPPPLHADLIYTGSGQLIGRWEIVVPGDELPTAEDLVPEGSLPIEERSAQRRYTQLSRFNVHLPPTGTYRLAGPDVSRFPTAIEGLYQVLLRVEASNDAVGNRDLSVVGEGEGVVTTGGLAGFSLPVLRYYVGAAGADLAHTREAVALLRPALEAVVASGSPILLEWRSASPAAFYRVEVNDPTGKPVLSAIVASPDTKYLAPPLIGERAISGKLTWRVIALNDAGKEVGRSLLSSFRHGIAEPAPTSKP